MTPARPALPDVLAVLTTCDDAEAWRDARGWRAGPLLSPDGSGAILRPTVWIATLHQWRHESPAGAVEALIDAELLPQHWSDPVRGPRWWCPWCNTPGDLLLPSTEGASTESCPDHSEPPSHSALVAVASLGVDTLARAEEIVTQTWRARIVWRVERPHERRDRLRSRRGSQAFGLSPEEPPEVFATSEAWQQWPSGEWPEECPAGFLALSGGDGETIRRAWPALRALAALDLHMLTSDDGRVTLAVEALP